jgi:hypothetical protein
MIPVERFDELRPYLFSIAYRMLGSATEAEDVLQDAWLRAGKAPEHLDSDRAWLAVEPGAWHAELAELNGEPALLVHYLRHLDTVFVLSVDEARIQSIHAVRNPEKLAWLKRQRSDLDGVPADTPSPVVQ